jgi:hypothetical protein
VTVPLTVRASVGSGLGFGCQHSQTLENWAAATPGSRWCAPATPSRRTDSCGRPSGTPTPRWCWSLARSTATGARSSRARRAAAARACARPPPGRAVTVVTLGQTTGIALRAAEATGLDLEVVDLLTVVPWDRATVLDSVRRTGSARRRGGVPAVRGLGARDRLHRRDRGLLPPHAHRPSGSPPRTSPSRTRADLEARYLPTSRRSARSSPRTSTTEPSRAVVGPRGGRVSATGAATDRRAALEGDLVVQYARMLEIRLFEERVNELFASARDPRHDAPVHGSGGTRPRTGAGAAPHGRGHRDVPGARRRDWPWA